MLVSGTRTGRSASCASSAAVASAASAGSNVRAAMVCIRTADDRTAEEDDAVHMIGQFASGPRKTITPTRAPVDKAHRTALRGSVLNDCGEPVSVALRMATVDPEAPASRVVSDPARVRAQRRPSPVAGPEPRYHYRYPPSPRGAATSLRDRRARRAGSRRARISPNDEAAGGSGSSTVESAITAVPEG